MTAILFWSMVGLSLFSWLDPALGVRLALQVEEPGPLTILQLGTSILVHADLWHLLGNAYFLVAFGRLPEVHLGSGRFAALFFASAGLGSLYYLVRYFGEEMVVLGASGGISGIIGAYAVMFPSHRVGLSLLVRVVPIPALLYFLGWAYLQVLLVGTEAQSGVGYAAHLLGFAVGIVWGIVERRRPEFEKIRAGDGSRAPAPATRGTIAG